LVPRSPTLSPGNGSRGVKRLARASLIVLLALAAPVLLALWLALSDRPALPPAPPWSLTELSRVKAVLGAELRRGNVREHVLTLTKRDLEIMVAQAARDYGPPRVDVDLTTGRARLRVSLALPANPLGSWLNLDAQLNDSDGMPGVDALRIGSLPVPAWLADAALGLALQRVASSPHGDAAARIVQRVSFVRGQVKVVVDWRSDSPRVLAASLVPLDQQLRLHAYADELATITHQLAATRREVSMAELVTPLFTLAKKRSDTADAAAENRAALLVLTLYANGRNLAAIVPQARGWKTPRPLIVTLNGRTDTPLHFLVSAAVAAEASGPLADAIGLYKEASDAQGGSGFSFNDLAADRAGTRFGLAATRAPKRLQSLLAGSVSESDLMPMVADLPEGLSAAEFAQRFGQVGTPAYDQVLADIETRIDRCRVYAGIDTRS
jgi:hypothetical protein